MNLATTHYHYSYYDVYIISIVLNIYKNYILIFDSIFLLEHENVLRKYTVGPEKNEMLRAAQKYYI